VGSICAGVGASNAAALAAQRGAARRSQRPARAHGRAACMQVSKTLVHRGVCCHVVSGQPQAQSRSKRVPRPARRRVIRRPAHSSRHAMPLPRERCVYEQCSGTERASAVPRATMRRRAPRPCHHVFCTASPNSGRACSSQHARAMLPQRDYASTMSFQPSSFGTERE